jgi:serine protease
MKRNLAMARQTRKVSASLSCLFLALSWSLGSAADGIAPSKRLRGEPSKKTESGNRRNLAKKKKAKGSERRSDPNSERMIVRCKPQMSDENCLEQLSTAGEYLNVIHRLSSLHSYAVEGDLSTLEDLQRMGIDVVPDYERVAFVLEDSIQYHRSLEQSIPNGVDLIGAKEVWEQYGVRGEGVKICVLDTGVEASHPDFADSNLSGYDGEAFVSSWDEDERGHGTLITGVIAASDNDEGVVGVAPGAEVYMVNVYRTNGRFYSSDILAAVEVCKDVGAKIINLSAGGTGFEDTEQEAFEQLYNEGILAVAASGNTGGSDTMYPAAYDKVLSVAASNSNDALAGFSTLNSFTNIAAPGT